MLCIIFTVFVCLLVCLHSNCIIIAAAFGMYSLCLSLRVFLSTSMMCVVQRGTGVVKNKEKKVVSCCWCGASRLGFSI